MNYFSVLSLAAIMLFGALPVSAQESWIEGFESDQNIIQYDVVDGVLFDYEFGDASSEYLEYAEDFSGHDSIWEQVQVVGGDTLVSDQISSLRLYTDGVGGFLAWVIQEDNWDTWLLALDVLDMENDPVEFQATLAHEIAHIWSLDNDEMDISGAIYDESIYDCDTYLNADGCLAEDSYLYLFVEEFWGDLLDVHERLDQDDEDALYDFYLDYEDQFVTSYAATNPEEDLAESYSYFVVWSYAPATDIWEQKLNFFAQFPELVARRDAIRAYYDLGDDPITTDDSESDDSEDTDEDAEEETSDDTSTDEDVDELVDVFTELFSELEDLLEDALNEVLEANDLDGDGVLTPTAVEEEETAETTELIDRLAGNIMLMVDERGEAWYIDPISRARYYLRDGETAYDFLRAFGLGISNTDLEQIPSETDAVGGGDMAERLAGRILLQVEERGEAWYVNPSDLKRYYLADGDAAYTIMRELSVGTMSSWISDISTGWIQ